MKIDLRSGEVCLQDSQPVRLNGARGLRVTCTAGTVWITQTGVTEDIFLQPGQSCRVCNDALALIESIGSGKVRFEQSETFALLKFMRNALQNLIHQWESLSLVRS
ncbi:MAG: hypothetical protein RLZZ298_2251 [Pseudomonadota bacterium]|jgi:hypothetical protein